MWTVIMQAPWEQPTLARRTHQTELLSGSLVVGCVGGRITILTAVTGSFDVDSFQRQVLPKVDTRGTGEVRLHGR